MASIWLDIHSLYLLPFVCKQKRKYLDYEDTIMKNVASFLASFCHFLLSIIRLHDTKKVSSCDNGTFEYKFMPWLILRTELLPCLFFYDNPQDIPYLLVKGIVSRDGYIFLINISAFFV
jgi:hypothetical protein